MIPSEEQYQDAKNLLADLELEGFKTNLRTIGNFEAQYPNITVEREGYVYHFSDPSWYVVIKQLKSLRQRLIF